MGETEEEKDQAGKLFENFIQASTCKGTLQSFNLLCRLLDLDPQDHETFYCSLKTRLTSWRAKALWTKLDKRTCHKEYKKGQACVGTKCLIIGGGPCGLRTAIELALLGAKVVVIEKRDTFSRNNVLHLWPYTIHDLKGLGAKKFYGKFCAGAIDHISIRQLQLMLLKIALLVAVEFHVNVEFVELLEPPENQENDGPGWRAEIRPADHPVANIDFDVVVGADGRRNTLEGFKRKEFRGKLAIAITANFVNRNTTAEAKVEEISGVAFIFNQKFFLDLKEETGIDLENIVYYKDNTHYFVMTAKKQSLLDKGVIIHDYIDTEMLLSSENVNQEALLGYAREAADFGTNYQLPTLDFAINACGQPDVAMFDFTSMYASENAALVRERFGHQLLVALVGDSLLEPFWPMGTGCARGFLAAFDSAWMVKRWAEGRTPLEVLAERESLYRILPQTTTENIGKNFEQYTIDPGTRYPNLISTCVRQNQVRHLYINGELPVKSCSLERNGTIRHPVNLARRESEIRPGRLLTWCQKQTEGYRNVRVTDLTTSWQSGLALCALIHRFRSHLIEFDSLNEEDSANNLQLACDLAEREFGIRPFTTGVEMAAGQEPDKTRMVTYLSKFYELFRGTPLPISDSRGADENSEDYPSKAVRSMNKVLNLVPRKRVPKDEKKLEDTDPTYKRRRKVCSYLEEATNFSSQSVSCVDEGRGVKENKVRSMASQLLSKFEESNPSFTLRRQKKAQTQNAREFHNKSIKEKAVHLRALFSGDVTSTSQSGSAEQTIPSPPILPAPTPKVTSLLCPEITLSTFSLPQTVSSSSSILLQLKTSQSGALDMQLCKKEMQRDPLNESHVCHSSGSTYISQQQRTAILQPKPEPGFNNVKQRTVGKVSLAIAARAETLVTLYETDHRPKASSPCSPPASAPLSPGSLRREFPGSGDQCHSCQKRVYVVERISAEGLYFHRECFRCDTCGSILRQGGHAFDSEQGKLYCKLHFTQRKNGMNHRRTFNSHLGAGVQEGSGTQTPDCDTTEGRQSQSPGTISSRLRKCLSWPLSVTRAVCDSPRLLSRWVHGTAHAVGLHFRANVQDYVFLYELLSLGVPLLFMLQEVLLQMYSETGPVSQSIQPLLLWLEEHLGHRLM
ncbi:F-actin-monooxygenase MICAL2 isoform X10 [Oncorhynchus mykiss]|uniref:F-actin-monooxygenase MICAL2 isoform X10 n=1 Tax=Oncorhynchus mykiss TaxID=8022 RepID=UPI001877CA22|nr:F-actin-monooxygenase MICAL2 isoform X10 [Oncorhynchus mykiss]